MTTLTIWKWPLELASEQQLALPINARLLCVQTQAEVPTLWAIVNPEEKLTSPKTVFMVGTGHPMPSGISHGEQMRNYLGTIQLHCGSLVFHFFFA